MADTDIKIEIRAIDNASKALRKIEKSLAPMKNKVGKIDKEFDKVDKSINRASGSFGKFKGLLAGAITVGGITAFTNSVVEASSRAEDLKTTLETVTGSAKAGDEAFKFINDFATRTPFDIETLTETFIKLKAAGIEPTEEMLTTFGDMAAVTTDRIGALNAITDAFSRTTAGGLGLEDLNRLADRGIPVFDIFQEKLGLTRLEVSEFGKSAEGAAKLKDALLEGLNERFGGGMEKASKNLSVSMSNLGIAFNNALIAVGEGGLSDAINTAALRMTDFIKNNEDLALALGEKLGQAVTMVVDGFGIFMEKMQQAEPIFDLIGMVLKEVVVPALGLMFDAAVALAEKLGPIIENLIPLGATVFETLGKILFDYVVPAFEKVVEIAKQVIEFVGNMIDKISAGLEKAAELVGAGKDMASAGWNKAKDAVGGAANAVGEFGGNVADSVGNGMTAAGNYVEDGVNNILGYFGYMSNEAVDNSIIPDMVDNIATHMDRLREILSDPVAMGAEIALQSMEMMGSQTDALIHKITALGDTASVSTDRFMAMSAAMSQAKFTDTGVERVGASPTSGGYSMESLDARMDRGQDVYGAIQRELGMTRIEIGDMLNNASINDRALFASKLDQIVGRIEAQTATPPDLNSNTNFNISGVTVNNGDRLDSPQARQYIEGVATRIAYNVLRQQTRFGGF